LGRNDGIDDRNSELSPTEIIDQSFNPHQLQILQKEKHGYYYGYTLALKERIILSDDSQAALVLKQDTDLYKQHLGINFKSRSLRSVGVDSNAIDKGKSAGSNVSLNQQFGVRSLTGC
jgi:hypothetical protein